MKKLICLLSCYLLFDVLLDFLKACGGTGLFVE